MTITGITCVNTNISDMTSTAAPEGRPLGTYLHPAWMLVGVQSKHQTVLSNQELTLPCRDAPEQSLMLSVYLKLFCMNQSVC